MFDDPNNLKVQRRVRPSARAVHESVIERLKWKKITLALQRSKEKEDHDANAKEQANQKADGPSDGDVQPPAHENDADGASGGNDAGKRKKPVTKASKATNQVSDGDGS